MEKMEWDKLRVNQWECRTVVDAMDQAKTVKLLPHIIIHQALLKNFY